MVMKAILIVLCNDPSKTLDWKSIKSCISSQIICKCIDNFNLDEVSRDTYTKLVKEVRKKNFTVIKSKMINPACGYYCEWVIQVHKYLKRKFEGELSEEVEEIEETPYVEQIIEEITQVPTIQNRICESILVIKEETEVCLIDMSKN